MSASLQRLRARTLRELFTAGMEPRLMLTACAVGLGAGIMAIVLAESIHAVQTLAIGSPRHALEVLETLPPWHRVLAPAAGGLVLGLLGRLLPRETRGHGVPEVMEAVALHGGRIRPHVALTKSVASAISIGSGGSVGREGPIVQIGAAVGSAFGQWLRVPADRLRTLTAAGAAGGLAAAFNAPIAGAFFALEVIARNFAAGTFGPVVLCAVFATLVSQLYFGAAPAFQVPRLALGSIWETPLAIPLGLFCGIVSVGFIVTMSLCERGFARLRVPAALKPALGGAVLGVMLLVAPGLYGIGYDVMDASLRGQLPVVTLALLLVLKPLATSVTLASGGSGGVFLPSLFLGGIAGGLFGTGAHALLPAASTGSGVWALVGMAAVLAGTSHAPITGILLAFELTQDYALILPVMLASTIATLVARTLWRDSIYTEKLSARGIDLDRREDLALRGLTLAELATPSAPAVRIDAPLDVVLARFLESDASTVFVTDAEDRPVGQVSIHDVKAAIGDAGGLGGLVVAGDVSEAAAVAPREATAAEALERLSRLGREALAVVDERGRLAGMVTLRAITDALARETLRGEVLGVSLAAAPGGHARGEALRLAVGLSVRTIRVPRAAAGQTLRSLEARRRFGVSVIALRRGAIDEGVDPDRPLQEGDLLVAVGLPSALERFQASLAAGGRSAALPERRP